jgi:hypothetical protein
MDMSYPNFKPMVTIRSNIPQTALVATLDTYDFITRCLLSVFTEYFEIRTLKKINPFFFQLVASFDQGTN